MYGSIAHRLIACTFDDDGNQEVRDFMGQDEALDGEQWRRWEGSALFLVDGRTRIEAEVLWAEGADDREGDYWLVDVHSSGESA